MIQKLIRGGPGRKSRFHTAQGHLVKLSQIIEELPGASITKILTKLSGKRPNHPWWTYAAIRCIETYLTSNMKVVEFGSGSSSIWLGKRAGSVISIEDNPIWMHMVEERVRNAGLANVCLSLRQDSDYYTLRASEHSFDLAIIDGSFRWECLKSVLPRMKPGAIVYLDNADAESDRNFYPSPLMHMEAQKILNEYARDNPSAKLNSVIGLVHGELFASEGWLLQTAIDRTERTGG